MANLRYWDTDHWELLGGGSTPYYGSFFDTTTQSVAANTATPMKFNTTQSNNGVSIVNDGGGNPTKITFANAGTYNVQFSAQLTQTDNSVDQVLIWFRQNGVDVADSNTNVTMDKQYSDKVASWNWVVDAAANDYVQIMWESNSTSVTLLAQAASTSPAYPAIPSVILTVTPVVGTGPQGPQGIQGVQGSQGSQGSQGQTGATGGGGGGNFPLATATTPYLGLVPDGVTDNSAAINALPVNSGHIYFLGTLLCKSAVTIPRGVTLHGFGKANGITPPSCIKFDNTASWANPVNLLTLGPTSSTNPDTSLENLQVDAGNIAGSTAIYISGSQEFSGLRFVDVVNVVSIGVWLDNTTYTSNTAKNWALSNIKITQGSGSSSAFVGIQVDANSTGFGHIGDVTIQGGSVGGTGILLNRVAYGSVRDIHIEGMDDGISIGKTYYCSNLSVENVSCASSGYTITNLVHICTDSNSSARSRSITVSKLSPGNSTNALNSDYDGTYAPSIGGGYWRSGPLVSGKQNIFTDMIGGTTANVYNNKITMGNGATIEMGSSKITGLAAGTNPGDAVNLAQASTPWRATQQGMIAVTNDPILTTGTFTPTKGIIYVSSIYIPTAGNVTNILHRLATAGTSLVSCYAGLMDSSGNVLATTADLSTTWAGSTGAKTLALSSPYNITTPGLYYVAFLVGNSTSGTIPVFGALPGISAALTNINATTVSNSLAGGSRSLSFNSGANALASPSGVPTQQQALIFAGLS